MAGRDHGQLPKRSHVVRFVLFFGIGSFFGLLPIIYFRNPAPKTEITSETFRRTVDLVNLCKELDIGNKTIILTVLSEGYIKYFPLWLNNTNRVLLNNGKTNLTQHFLVVTFDNKAYSLCKLHGLNCWMDVNPRIERENSIQKGGNFILGTGSFKSLVWRRMEVCYWILKQGYNVLFSDFDIIWLKDPFPIFDNVSDFQIGRESYDMNSGFWLLKHNEMSIKFFHEWTYGVPCRETSGNQASLNYMLKEKAAFKNVFNLTVNVLHPLHARTGCTDKWEWGIQGKENQTRVYHPTCTVGLDWKIDLVNKYLVKYYKSVAKYGA